MKGVLFSVCFTKHNTPPTSSTHSFKQITSLRAMLKYITLRTYSQLDRTGHSVANGLSDFDPSFLFFIITTTITDLFIVDKLTKLLQKES